MVRRMGLLIGVLALSLTANATAKRALVVLKTPSASGFTTQSVQAHLQAVAESLRQNQFQVEDTLKKVNTLVVRINGQQDLDKLRQNPSVALVDEEIMLPAPKPVNGAFHKPNMKLMNETSLVSSTGGMPWGIKAVHAPEAWNVAKSSFLDYR